MGSFRSAVLVIATTLALVGCGTSDDVVVLTSGVETPVATVTTTSLAPVQISTTTAPTPAATALNLVFAIATHGLHPESLPGSGGCFGSGCTPGSDALPDGIWYGSVQEATMSTVTFDLACLRWIPDPNDDAIEEGGWELSNSSSQLRVVPVHPDARVTSDWIGYPLSPFPFSDWIEGTESRFPVNAWLYVNGGVVSEVGQMGLAG